MIVGLMSALLVLVSFLGVSSKGPNARRSARPDDRTDRVLWI
jgi:hypothetical protein